MAQTLANSSTGRQSRISGFERGAIHLFNLLQNWGDRARTRRHLYQMPDYILSDIGITRADVAGEYQKPFWRE
jgi:uncharacterized protein YjiS (DUF1127 family)